MAFGPDSRSLASGGREKSALGEVVEKIFGRSRGAGNGDTVRLWRADDGSLSQVLSAHAGDLHGLAFSPDGRWLATSGDDRAVKLWALAAQP